MYGLLTTLNWSSVLFAPIFASVRLFIRESEVDKRFFLELGADVNSW